jgi:hypothetical protein
LVLSIYDIQLGVERSAFNADELSQMPIRERNTRPGFQIALKGNGAPLVGEFNDDIDGPRPVLGRVSTAACVVLGTSSRHV